MSILSRALRLLNVFTGEPAQVYRFHRLVDYLVREDFAGRPLQIICDIDKTYLETEFETFYKIARVALESARHKISVHGAPEVLNALRWGDNTVSLENEGYPRPLHFVSSSPPQLRTVLESKMSLDSLDWTSDCFKNQVYNIFKGRVDLLSHHVGYKSAAILRTIFIAGKNVKYIALGDNAESDAYIYVGIKLLLEKSISASEYESYLRAGGVDSAVAQDIIASLEEIPEGASLEHIFIRNAPGFEFVDHPCLSGCVTLFDDYFDLSCKLHALNLISDLSLHRLSVQFINQYGFTRRRVQAYIDRLPADIASNCENQRPILSSEQILKEAQLWQEKLHVRKTSTASSRAKKR